MKYPYLILLFFQKKEKKQESAEFFPEGLEGGAHLGFHGFNGNAELFGDFPVFKTLLAVHPENLLPFFGQRSDAFLDFQEGFGSDGVIFGSIIGEEGFLESVGMELSYFILADHVKALVPHRPEEVMAQRRLHDEAAAFLPEFDEEILDHLPGLVIIVEEVESIMT